jgi:BrnA antitoxin of type II toxin-antitoxin system
MRAEYDFSQARRGALLPSKGKTRITIYIDNEVLGEFRSRAEKAGTGYQTMINEILRAHLSQSEPPVTETVLRRVLREELPEAQKTLRRSGGKGVKAAAGAA